MTAMIRRLLPRSEGLLVLGGVLAMLLLAVATWNGLPARLVVHWPQDQQMYVGIETLPKAVGVLIVPAMTALFAGGLIGLERVLGKEFPDPALEATLWVLVGSMLAAQGLLLGLNLL